MTAVRDVPRWVSDTRADRLLTAARWWAPTAIGLLALGSWVVGIPSSGQSGFAETLVQLGFLLIYSIGFALSYRWAMTGATVMAASGIAVGALSAVQHEPLRGLVIALALYAPAGLMWLSWQRRRSAVSVGVLGVALVALLLSGGVAANRIFDYFYGPVAPASARAPLPLDHVEWMWSGALRPSSAVVVAAIEDRDGASVSLVYHDGVQPTLDSQRVVGVPSPTDPDVVRFTLRGLVPDTTYRYAVVVDEAMDTTRGEGSLHTPDTGAYSFQFTYSSCARLGSNAATYDAIEAAAPLFHLVTGDFFYADIAVDDVDIYRDAYDAQLTPGAPSAMFRRVPLVYTWDDHDYGPNDADRTSPSRAAAWAAYRAFVPHYPLLERRDSGPINQAFTIGRVRFIVTDLRSERDPMGDPAGSMLGQTQRRWLERELLAGSRKYPLVVWVSSVPWLVHGDSPGDSWGAYPEERTGISDFIVAHDIDNLVMLAGDSHMLAVDDGSHNDFASGGGPSFPVLQAAALDQLESVKGGPYSEGIVTGPGQFALVTIEDDGRAVTLHYEGRSWTGQTVLEFTWQPPPEAGPAAR